MKNKTFLIDLSSFMSLDIMTGIQRVVIEFTTRFIKSNKNVVLIYWNKSKNFYIIDNDFFLKNCYKSNRLDLFMKEDKTIFNFNKIDNNYCLVEYDSTFDFLNNYPRFKFYNDLKAKGCQIFIFFHDILPIICPQYWATYSDSFLFYFAAALKCADKIICSSNYFKNIIENIQKDILKKNTKVYKIKLGCNPKSDYNLENISQEIKTIVKADYILHISTFEPRKNHITLIESYLSSKINTNYNLVLVGRLGWNYKEILSLINRSSLRNKKIYVFNNVNDDEIVYLYKHAKLFVFPSFIEGYGLPIVESLYYKCPTIASNIPVFKEIAEDNIMYFNPNDKKDIASKIEQMLLNKDNLNKYKEKINNFSLTNWDISFSMLLKAILE